MSWIPLELKCAWAEIMSRIHKNIFIFKMQSPYWSHTKIKSRYLTTYLTTRDKIY